MTKLKNIIDFELIWKKIHNTISIEEKFRLDQWTLEKKSHKQYIENAEKYYKSGSDFNNNPENIGLAWKKISNKIEKKKSLRLKYAALISAAASIILLFTIFLNWNGESNQTSNLVSDTISCNEKAILVLNGKTYKLGKGKELLFEENGISIESTGKEVAYKISGRNHQTSKLNSIKIPRGGFYKIKLSDGSTVWLNSESSLSYPIQFNENERIVALSGEAFFEVCKNEHAPFKVITGEQTVEVLGTSFNISSYKEDSVIYTTLVEGKVSVSSNINPEIKEVLLPNEQSIINKENGGIYKQKVDIEQYVSWKNGHLIFKDQPLENITKTLSKWYDVSFQFKTDSIRKIKFTGDLKREDSFENILSKLEKTDEVKFEIKGRNVLIK